MSRNRRAGFVGSIVGGKKNHVMGTRVCKSCGVDKPYTSFPNRVRGNAIYYDGVCTQCGGRKNKLFFREDALGPEQIDLDEIREAYNHAIETQDFEELSNAVAHIPALIRTINSYRESFKLALKLNKKATEDDIMEVLPVEEYKIYGRRR